MRIMEMSKTFDLLDVSWKTIMLIMIYIALPNSIYALVQLYILLVLVRFVNNRFVTCLRLLDLKDSDPVVITEILCNLEMFFAMIDSYLMLFCLNCVLACFYDVSNTTSNDKFVLRTCNEKSYTSPLVMFLYLLFLASKNH